MHCLRKTAGHSLLTISILVMLTLIAGLFPIGLAGAEWLVTVSINSPDEVDKDNYFITTVEISEVSALNAVQYDVLFDPSIINLEKIDEGRMDGGTVMPVLHNEISPGHIRVIQSMGLDSVDGTGILSVIKFHALQTGESAISLSNGTLSGFDGEIMATWIDDSVAVLSTESGTQDSSTTSPSLSDEAPSESDLDTGEGEMSVAPESDIEETPVETESENSIEGSATTPTSESDNIDTDNEEDSPKQPVAENKGVNWAVLWGIIGGVAVLTALIVYNQFFRRRRY